MQTAFIHPAEILLLPTSKGIDVIDTATIVRIEALSNYSKLYFTNGKTLVVSKVLRWFGEQLCNGNFLRTHRKHLINKRFITCYVHEQGGQICLENGEKISVSKRKKHFFLQSWYRAA